MNWPWWIFHCFTHSELQDFDVFFSELRQNNGSWDDYIHFRCTISPAISFRKWQNVRWTLLCFSEFWAFESKEREKKARWTKSNEFIEGKSHAWLCGLALTQGRGHSLSDVKVSEQPTVSLYIRIICHCSAADIPLWSKELQTSKKKKNRKHIFFTLFHLSYIKKCYASGKGNIHRNTRAHLERKVFGSSRVFRSSFQVLWT